jgi:DNA ligase-1
VANEIIHKAVELAKVKTKRRKELEQPGYLAKNYIAQPKHDGCNTVMKFYPDGTVETTSRTGEPNRAMGRAERALWPRLADRLMPSCGLVVLGEAWWPGKDQFSEISGHFRRHSESDRLRLVAFDALTMTEFEAGRSDVGYLNRLKRLGAAAEWPDSNPDPAQLIRSYSVSTDPHELCARFVDKGGYDGIIYRDPDGTWEAGRGTNGELIKIKRKLSFDLRVTATYEGLGKNKGRVGAIGVSFRGATLRCNAGTDAEREAWFADPSLIVGKIVEVEAMDFSSEGLLREPRYKGIRHDKLEPDA